MCAMSGREARTQPAPRCIAREPTLVALLSHIGFEVHEHDLLAVSRLTRRSASACIGSRRPSAAASACTSTCPSPSRRVPTHAPQRFHTRWVAGGPVRASPQAGLCARGFGRRAWCASGISKALACRLATAPVTFPSPPPRPLWQRVHNCRTSAERRLQHCLLPRGTSQTSPCVSYFTMDGLFISAFQLSAR